MRALDVVSKMAYQAEDPGQAAIAEAVSLLVIELGDIRDLLVRYLEPPVFVVPAAVDPDDYSLGRPG